MVFEAMVDPRKTRDLKNWQVLEMTTHGLFNEDGVPPPGIPLWVKVCLVTTTAATVTTSVTILAVIAQAGPELETLSSQIGNVFSGFNVPEMRTALDQAVKVLNYLCAQVVDCR